MRSRSRPDSVDAAPLRVALAALAILLGVGAIVAAARGRCVAAEAAAAPVPDLPARLADTGLYADVPSHRIAPGVRRYAPQYPLWTDGARKERWISLPEGASIDASDPDAWVFPVGTRLWKEFAFERRVETRYLERLPDGSWRFATYLWNAKGTDAVLAPEAGARGVAESRPGVAYDVPGRADCLVCHGGRATPVLGFSALQLSPDRDPLAPHATAPAPGDVDLATLEREGTLRGLPASFAARPPRVEAPTPRARAALGWLHANCGTCHAEGGRILGLDLRLDVRLAAERGTPGAIETSLGQESRWRLPGAADAPSVRLAPGDPRRSVLYRRASSRNPLVQMPPLGTRVVDAEGVALLEAWIREDLAPASAPAPAGPSPDAPSLETVR